MLIKAYILSRALANGTNFCIATTHCKCFDKKVSGRAGLQNYIPCLSETFLSLQGDLTIPFGCWCVTYIFDNHWRSRDSEITRLGYLFCHRYLVFSIFLSSLVQMFVLLVLYYDVHGRKQLERSRQNTLTEGNSS